MSCIEIILRKLQPDVAVVILVSCAATAPHAANTRTASIFYSTHEHVLNSTCKLQLTTYIKRVSMRVFKRINHKQTPRHEASCDRVNSPVLMSRSELTARSSGCTSLWTSSSASYGPCCSRTSSFDWIALSLACLWCFCFHSEETQQTCTSNRKHVGDVISSSSSRLRAAGKQRIGTLPPLAGVESELSQIMEQV